MAENIFFDTAPTGAFNGIKQKIGNGIDGILDKIGEVIDPFPTYGYDGYDDSVDLRKEGILKRQNANRLGQKQKIFDYFNNGDYGKNVLWQESVKRQRLNLDATKSAWNGLVEYNKEHPNRIYGTGSKKVYGNLNPNYLNPVSDWGDIVGNVESSSGSANKVYGIKGKLNKVYGTLNLPDSTDFIADGDYSGLSISAEDRVLKHPGGFNNRQEYLDSLKKQGEEERAAAKAKILPEKANAGTKLENDITNQPEAPEAPKKEGLPLGDGGVEAGAGEKASVRNSEIANQHQLGADYGQKVRDHAKKMAQSEKQGIGEKAAREVTDDMAGGLAKKMSKMGLVGTGVAAVAAAAGIYSALNSSRGQQSNAQLYGQQPLY